MASTGDIYNGPYASRAKEYVWSTLRSVFPRGITPTDIDGVVEINNCFFVFEGKTEGKKIDKGQGLALRRMMMRWPETSAVFVVGEHPDLECVDAITINRVQLAWREGNNLKWSEVINQKSALTLAAERFVQDSATGALYPAAWCADWRAWEAPFTEASA